MSIPWNLEEFYSYNFNQSDFRTSADGHIPLILLVGAGRFERPSLVSTLRASTNSGCRTRAGDYIGFEGAAWLSIGR